MSDKENDAELTEAANEAEPVNANEPEPVKQARSPVGLLALAVSLLALAGVGYIAWQDLKAASDAENSADSLSRLAARVDASRESLIALQNQVDEQGNRNSRIDGRLNEAESTLSNPADLLGSIPSRVATMERNVAALQGVSAGTRDTWLLAEAEYYLQIANAQLQLANNPQLAAMALRMADERVADLANPAYTDVRAEIANELAALEVMNKVDIAGTTLTLSSLARVVDSLPVRIVGEETEEGGTGDIDEELSGGARAWASVKDAFSGLVKVSKPDEGNSPLMTPDAEALLRVNLSLQLQAARLALLQGEREVFDQSLDDANDWLEQYFDAESVPVSSALDTINEIRNSPAMSDLPDISGSLRLLRQYRTLGDDEQ